MSNNPGKKRPVSNREVRKQKTQKVIFAIIALILIVSWILTLVVKF